MEPWGAIGKYWWFDSWLAPGVWPVLFLSPPTAASSFLSWQRPKYTNPSSIQSMIYQTNPIFMSQSQRDGWQMSFLRYHWFYDVVGKLKISYIQSTYECILKRVPLAMTNQMEFSSLLAKNWNAILNSVALQLIIALIVFVQDPASTFTLVLVLYKPYLYIKSVNVYEYRLIQCHFIAWKFHFEYDWQWLEEKRAVRFHNCEGTIYDGSRHWNSS